MDLELQGRHALVTGGSKGIGFACAQALLREGARVSLVARDPVRLQAAAAELRRAGPPDLPDAVDAFAADLRDAAAALSTVDAVEAQRGAVDILVNCAGAARRTPPDELTPAHWRDALEAKFLTYVHVMDPLIKRMAARGRGAICNVVGMGGKVATAIHLPGGAANAALMLASTGLAAAYATRGVRVNVVNPALTLTERMHEGLAADARHHGITPEEALARAGARMPLGRAATPDEVAAAVVFLCSPRASYISGAVLSVDGALSAVVV